VVVSDSAGDYGIDVPDVAVGDEQHIARAACWGIAFDGKGGLQRLVHFSATGIGINLIDYLPGMANDGVCSGRESWDEEGRIRPKDRER